MAARHLQVMAVPGIWSKRRKIATPAKPQLSVLGHLHQKVDRAVKIMPTLGLTLGS